MKKILYFIVFFLASNLSSAQIVESYPNSDRYLYLPFVPTNNTDCFNQLIINSVAGIGNGFEKTIYGHIYYANQQEPVIVYGVALPIFDLAESENTSAYYPYPYEYRWSVFLNYIDTMSRYIFLFGKNERTQTAFDTVAMAPIRIGEAAIVDNFFHMPDTGNCPEMTMPVLEVYFQNPYTMTDSFFIGTHLWHDYVMQYDLPTPVPIMTGFNLFNRSSQILENCIYFQYANHSGIDTIYKYRIDNPFWGGPFAIIAPPPCTAPNDVHVASQHKKGVMLEWTAPVGSLYAEVEYGPEGFATGTGTTIGPIYPNSQHICSVSIDSLNMLSNYTARVRSRCANSGDSYSDWATIDFTTEKFYSLVAQVNNDDWATAYGSGDYCDGCQAQIRALPKRPYCYFLGWSDGVMQNARTITVTQDSVLTAIYSFDSTMSIPTVAPLTFTLSPNPTGSLLYVTIPNGTAIEMPGGGTRAEIFDDRGRKVADYKFHTSKFEIDVSTLPDGHYTLRLSSGKNVGTKGFVKQR